ncbi:hypothetical protein [Arthrobacter sp. Soil762]|uniref:SLOG cluster 4 domain-containing protein n=1 Tax=Arthrobacter sp. Soil762 TaxID=1736401 RepID=UPI0012E35DC9|nr:hypothetical protein [Arthrobacter sp. Soil762]
MANDPRLILADEPTANLDAKTGQDVTLLLCETACRENRAVIMVSHDQRLRTAAKKGDHHRGRTPRSGRTRGTRPALPDAPDRITVMKMTDEELLAALADPADDPARMERISTEIDAEFRLLSGRLGKAVAVFGSARPGPEDPRYTAARTMGARFADAGFAVITGGGPGLMEAANRGATEAGGTPAALGIQGGGALPLRPCHRLDHARARHRRRSLAVPPRRTAATVGRGRHRPGHGLALACSPSTPHLDKPGHGDQRL